MVVIVSLCDKSQLEFSIGEKCSSARCLEIGEVVRQARLKTKPQATHSHSAHYPSTTPLGISGAQVINYSACVASQVESSRVALISNAYYNGTARFTSRATRIDIC